LADVDTAITELEDAITTGPKMLIDAKGEALIDMMTTQGK